MHGSSNNPVYLSEATFNPPPQINILNFIEAPMGSGKNTWASRNTGDIKLMLVCTNALLEEAKLDGWQEIRQDQFCHQWEKWAFGDNIPTNTKYVTTIQHFSRWLPDLAHCRRLQICYVDECDLVLLHMRRWHGNNAQLGDNFIRWLGEACGKMLCICMSATGVVSAMGFVGKYLPSQLCKPIQPLKQYSREYRVFMSGVLRIAQLVDSGEKVLVYCQHPRTVQALKNKLAILGIDRVRCIVSQSAKAYVMDEKDNEAMDVIVGDKRFPNCDVLIVNNAANRGLNIKDRVCKHVVIIDGEEDEGKQTHGRLRYDGVNVWEQANSEWVENNMDKAMELAQQEVREDMVYTGRNWKDFVGMHNNTVEEMRARMLIFGIKLVKKGRRYGVEHSQSEMPEPTPIAISEESILPYKLNTWYSNLELYDIFQLYTLVAIEQSLLPVFKLIKGTPRINGKQSIRYKITKQED